MKSSSLSLLSLSALLLKFTLFLSSAIFITVSTASSSTNNNNDNKFEQLVSSNGLLSLTTANYQQLLFSPHNQSVFVLFSAAKGEFGCVVCPTALQEYLNYVSEFGKKANKQNTKGNGGPYFAVVEYRDEPEIFKQFNIQSAPIILHFKPSQSEFSADPYAFHDGVLAGNIANFVGRSTGIFIEMPKPKDWTKVFLFLFALVSTATVVKLFSTQALALLFDYRFWSAFCVGFVALMMSGFMWSQIRKPPYVGAVQGSNRLSWIHPHFQGQFGLESQIILVLNGVCSLAVLLLSIHAPKIVNPKWKQIAVMVYMTILLIGYSALLAIFKIKNPAYPFKFLF